MTHFDKETRRLLLQAAFTAVNYRLKRQVASLLIILPELVEDEADRRLCHALMLYGLDRKTEALGEISERTDPEARAVRALIAGDEAPVSDGDAPAQTGTGSNLNWST
jgi:type III secretion system SsaH family protein